MRPGNLRSRSQTDAVRLSKAIADLRLQRGARHLHRLGERAVLEFLEDMVDRYGLTEGVLALLRDYDRLTPEMLTVTGGDRFAPGPLDPVPPDLDGEARS